MITKLNEVERLKTEYNKRDRRFEGRDIYTPFNKSYLFMTQQRSREELSMLRKRGYFELKRFKILELGCGRGDVLFDYLRYGADPANLHGTDLLQDRVLDARSAMPHLPLTCADGQYLPYASNMFDLVLQYTVFSSVLDVRVKAGLAKEMLRVLKPDGMILWYDFWINPLNKQTRGIQPAEIRRLFPGCRLRFKRVTLAPPITRKLVHITWLGCAVLEKIKLFNTHYLAAIHPNVESSI
jgi:ubiquinone/menaquinone biosynthesis C-methylase UbiE